MSAQKLFLFGTVEAEGVQLLKTVNGTINPFELVVATVRRLLESLNSWNSTVHQQVTTRKHQAKLTVAAYPYVTADVDWHIQPGLVMFFCQR